jgi:peroxidase
VLFNGGATDAQVQSYVVGSQTAFFADDITPLTGSSGQIRNNCRRVN